MYPFKEGTLADLERLPSTREPRSKLSCRSSFLSSVTTSAQYAVNNLNQITSWTEREGVLDAGCAVRKTVNYTFDLAGNRSSRTELDAGGTSVRKPATSGTSRTGSPGSAMAAPPRPAAAKAPITCGITITAPAV